MVEKAATSNYSLTHSKEFIFCLLRPISEDKKIAREGRVKLFED